MAACVPSPPFQGERDRERWVIEKLSARATPVAALSNCSYISAETKPRPTMDQIGATDAKRYLSRLLDRVAQGESLTITRHGKPVARLIPVTGDRERAQEAANRIIERRKHLKRAPITDLMATLHEGHSR